MRKNWHYILRTFIGVLLGAQVACATKRLPSTFSSPRVQQDVFSVRVSILPDDNQTLATDHRLMVLPPNQIRLDTLSALNTTLSATVLQGDEFVTWMPSHRIVWHTPICQFLKAVIGFCPRELGGRMDMIGDLLLNHHEVDSAFETSPGACVIRRASHGGFRRELCFKDGKRVSRVRIFHKQSVIHAEYEEFHTDGTPSQIRMTIERPGEIRSFRLLLGEFDFESLSEADFKLQIPRGMTRREGMPSLGE